MKSTIKAAICLVFLAYSSVLSTEGMSVEDIGMDLRCRCIETESRQMAKLIQSVALFPPNAHCENTEIIATLKGTGLQICLDTTAPWVKMVIEKILANKKP